MTSFTFLGRLGGTLPVYRHRTWQGEQSPRQTPAGEGREDLRTAWSCSAGRGRGEWYRLRDCSQGVRDFHGFLHGNLGDHGAQREDDDAVFSRGVHHGFKFLPKESKPLVTAPSLVRDWNCCHAPTRNSLERQQKKQ